MMVILATFIKLDIHTMTMALNMQVLDLTNEVLNIHFGQWTSKKSEVKVRSRKKVSNPVKSAIFFDFNLTSVA